MEGSRNSSNRGESGEGRRDRASELDWCPREEGEEGLQFDAFGE